MKAASVIGGVLTGALKKVSDRMKADALCIAGPLLPGADRALRDAVEAGKDGRRKAAAIVLHTEGGVAEVVERMVKIIRSFYREVSFVIPDRAMSAGTMLAMSGDRILMDYYSCLGPIDAQVEKDGVLFSTDGYIRQFEELKKKSANGALAPAEALLLQKMDLAELESYIQERHLAVELLEKWLSNYKFKDWGKTETRKTKVTPEMRRERAKKIAAKLGDNSRWHTHGRPIGMDALRELGLKVEDYAENQQLAESVKIYFSLMEHFVARERVRGLVQLGNSLEVF